MPIRARKTLHFGVEPAKEYQDFSVGTNPPAGWLFWQKADLPRPSAIGEDGPFSDSLFESWECC